jgi:hypothetical protein
LRRAWFGQTFFWQAWLGQALLGQTLGATLEGAGAKSWILTWEKENGRKRNGLRP